MSNNVVDYNTVRAMLNYDRETGIFTRKVRTSNRVHVGEVAGCPNSEGHLTICLRGRNYYAHRLAWLYVYGEWPAGNLDHVNRDPSDNRISNLRICNQTQNNANTAPRKSNTSGFKGVSWSRKDRRWVAGIRVNGKKKFLGNFRTKEAAAEAYMGAAIDLHGDFAWRDQTR